MADDSSAASSNANNGIGQRRREPASNRMPASQERALPARRGIPAGEELRSSKEGALKRLASALALGLSAAVPRPLARLVAQEAPPRRRPASFSVGDALEKLMNSRQGDN